MDANTSLSSTSLDERDRKNYTKMNPWLKRTCLSAESALTGRPNVEDVPLDAKLPMIPGNKLVLYTTNLCEKLHLPSCDFDGTYPNDVYVSNEYRCLHDPHLKGFFFDRPAMRKRLRKNNFITPDRKVVCSLKEYNLYRQYLKHLSIQYLNKKYLEQYEKELSKNHEEKKKKIEEKRKDINNPLNKRIERARSIRKLVEAELERRRVLLVREMQKYTERRDREKKEERLRKMIQEERRERDRERSKKEKALQAEEEIITREKLRRHKHREEVLRHKAFEERLKYERKCKERNLLENYEKKKKLHHAKMVKLKQIVADEETRRKSKVARREIFFAKKHKSILDALESFKQKEHAARAKQDALIQQRLKARGWTGSPCRPRHKLRCSGKPKKSVGSQFGFGDGSMPAMIDLLRQLEAMGFHDVLLPTEILKAIWSTNTNDELEQSAGDANSARLTLSQQAGQFCQEIVTQGSATEFVRRVIKTAQELEIASQIIVAKVINVSRNVLLPMLESYEARTGTTVATHEIPEILRDLSSDVFNEDEDHLPQIFSFHEGGNITVHAGQRKSNVRFVISNTELPLEIGQTKDRPPTPRRVRFFSSNSDSESDDIDLASDLHIVLEEAIRKLSEKVVLLVFNNNLMESDSDDDKENINERVNGMAKSIIEEIILFDADKSAPSKSHPKSFTTSSAASRPTLVEKISRLARQLITDVVRDGDKTGGLYADSYPSSSATSSASTGSNLSVLALRVVKSILQTVDPTTGKTVLSYTESCRGLEEKVANLSAKIVEEIIREKRRKNPKDLDCEEYAELEEKISRLALNIISSAIDGKRPESSVSLSSICSAEIEEKVIVLCSRILKGIVTLKEILPKGRKTTFHDLPKPADSVERLLREIFNIHALEEAPDSALKKVTNADIKRMTNEIARRLVPERCHSSAMSSGASELATALAENALALGQENAFDTTETPIDLAVNTLADIVVEEALTDNLLHSGESKISSALSKVAGTLIQETLQRGEVATKLFSSSESRLSSAISEIAQVIAHGVLQKASTESIVSSGASDLAGAITQEAINTANYEVTGDVVVSPSSSAVESGISELASNTVDQAIEKATVINSSTRSAVTSGIKALTEKITQYVLEVATADPNGAGSSTRSAISSGASHLAAQIASMVTRQDSISKSALESILTSTVSEVAAEMLTERVLHFVREQGADVGEEKLAKEAEKLIQSMLEMNIGEKNVPKTSTETISTKGISASSAFDSALSDLVSDVVKELLSYKGSLEHVTEESASSAISAVATRYIQQMLGMTVDTSTSGETTTAIREEDIVPSHATTLHTLPPRRTSDDDVSSAKKHTPHPPKSSAVKNKGTKSRPVKGMSADSLQNKTDTSKRNSNFTSSFTDWRRNQDEVTSADRLKGKSLSALEEVEPAPMTLDGQTRIAGDHVCTSASLDDFDEIMDSLASRIVLSIVANREIEGEQPQADEDVTRSSSVEQMVGNMALGIVSSLLGLDVLNNASSEEIVEDDARSQNGSDIIQIENGNGNENAPGPSARLSASGSFEKSPLIENADYDSASDHEDLSKNLLSILCSNENVDDKNDPARQSLCEDTAQEHPHRVRSPTSKEIAARAHLKKQGLKGPKRSSYPTVSGWISSKLSPKNILPKSLQSSHQSVPLRQSTGFLDSDRLWLTDSKNSHSSEKKTPIKQKRIN